MTKMPFNPVIYLIGFPASGKYTTAKAIVKARPEIRLVDNHLVNNPIFSVIELNGVKVMPKGVWPACVEIWETVLKTMTTLSPYHFGFVLTNVLVENDPEDKKQYERVQTMAEKRGVEFFPIHLECSVAEMENRIDNKDRASRFKAVDKTLPSRLSQEKELIYVSHNNYLKINTTNLPPEKTAEKILKHVEKVLS